MTEMGHGLDLMVTAEGVETEAERETITRLGVDVMQGYLASKPLHGEHCRRPGLMRHLQLRRYGLRFCAQRSGLRA